jgi:hypothetical protein
VRLICVVIVIGALVLVHWSRNAWNAHISYTDAQTTWRLMAPAETLERQQSGHTLPRDRGQAERTYHWDW